MSDEIDEAVQAGIDRVLEIQDEVGYWPTGDLDDNERRQRYISRLELEVGVEHASALTPEEAVRESTLKAFYVSASDKASGSFEIGQTLVQLAALVEEGADRGFVAGRLRALSARTPFGKLGAEGAPTDA